MKITRSTVVSIVAGGLLTPAVVGFNAPAAHAQDVHTRATPFASITFDDSRDRWRVCDIDRNGEGVWGRIMVRQPNGHWNPFPGIYWGGGAGTCSGWKHNDIVREFAPVRLEICNQDGEGGRRYGCYKGKQNVLWNGG